MLHITLEVRYQIARDIRAGIPNIRIALLTAIKPRRLDREIARCGGTWERGSGVTLACGTGACAVAVAGVLTGRTGRKLLAHLPGGDLELEWAGDGEPVFMTGPATEVFTGTWAE